MSKASEYADVYRHAIGAMPADLESSKGITLARVYTDGQLSLSGGNYSPADALRLRDWLTENFGEETMTHLDRRG